jgi:hypothetical protein
MSLIITGCNEEPQYLEMRRRLVNSIHANCPLQEVQSVTFAGASREESAVARVGLFQKAFEVGWTQVAWLDVDTLVRAPLDDFWADVGPGVLKVFHKPKEPDRFKFNSGVVAIGTGAGDMLKGWQRRVIKNNKWFRDQECLWKAYAKSDMELVPLPMKYNDSRFSADSVIWHGKGHSRLDGRWIRESAKYA